MPIPEEDRRTDPHPYGDYRRVSADGRYWFEWTPFTPAITAWRNAERQLRAARGHLAEAGRLTGFAIVGLDEPFAQYAAAVEVFTEHVEDAVNEAAEVVIPVLEVANITYGRTADASREQYEHARAVVDGALVGQGRKPMPNPRQGGI
jgi:hypothetical protein